MISQRKHAPFLMLDQILFIFVLPKNARGRNDRDYNCDCYTYLKVLNMI